MNRLNLYTIAGVATAPDFMEEFRITLCLHFDNAGYEVHSTSIFPYGDWNTNLLAQIR